MATAPSVRSSTEVSNSDLPAGAQPADLSRQSPDDDGDSGRVPVSQPQRELLNNNEVMEKFLSLLEDKQIHVEAKSLHTESIVVLQGDAGTARQCLASVICADSVTFEPSRETENISSLTGLQSRFGGQFAVHFSQGKAEVAFLPGIQREVMSVLDDIKKAVKRVPLPGYMVDYLQRHLQSFTVKFNSNFRSPVDLSIVTDPQNHLPYLKLRCERATLPEAERVLENMLTLLCLCVLEVDLSRANYLKSSAGKTHVQAAENNSHCTMNIETPDERVLLIARSSLGHLVKVCEGSMATTDCDMLVLPLKDGQEEWSPSYKCILQRGCYSPNTTDYLRRVGAPPKPLTLCQGSAASQTVIIMYVPRSSDASFQDSVYDAVKEAITTARDARFGLALPLKLCGDISSDAIKRILGAVVDCCNDNNLPCETRFYLAPGDTWPGDIGSFFQEHNWTVETVTDPVDSIFDQRVIVTVGDIKSAEGDVVVNSTDKELKHGYGQVSRVLLRECGPELVQQCQQRYPRGMADRVVAITEAFNFRRFKYIFHVALPKKQWDPSDAAQLLRGLKSRVEACLFLASVKALSSIVFPALATGNLRYPADVEARTVLAATREFFSRMPHSSLRRVNFVAYRENPAVVKEFKAEETVNRYSLHRVPSREKVDRRYTMASTLVQVVLGDAKTRLCTAQHLICAAPPAAGSLRDYQGQPGMDCTVEIVNSGSVKTEVREILKRTTSASVQLNMQTFDAGQSDNLFTGMYNGLKNSRTVQFVVVMVDSHDTFLRLCRTLARSYTSATGRGGGGPREQDQARVAICGSLSDTKKAITKVMEPQVPELYVQGVRDYLHPRFLEPTEPVPRARPATSPGAAGQSVSMAARGSTSTGPSSQNQSTAMMTVPREQLKGQEVDIIDALQTLNISVSFRRGEARFRAEHRDMAQLTACVQETLARLNLNRAQTAPAARAPDDGFRAGGPAGDQSGPAQPVTSTNSQDGHDLTAGSVHIPSTFLTQKAGLSQGKNILGIGKEDGDKRPQPGPTVGDSSFMFVDRPGDGAGGSKPLGQASADAGFQAADVSDTKNLADRTGSPRSDDRSTAMEAEALASLNSLVGHQTGVTSSTEVKSLRQQEIILTTEEMTKLGTSVNVQSEGIAAFVRVLPDQQKVVIFASDYETLNKAVHIVKVKCGKTKISRLKSKGEYDGQSSTYIPMVRLPTQSSMKQKANDQRFVTTGGLTVRVYTADITTLTVDAIVNAAHEKLIHKGGVAAAIALAAGQSLKDEGNAHIATHGPLKVADVAVTTAGALPCRKVLHALGPRWTDYRNKRRCQQDLVRTIFNCLETAQGLALTSIAFSSISSATFGVLPQVCAESYLSGVLDFDEEHGSSTSLRQIHFVDVSESMVSCVRNAFAHGLSTA